LTAQIGLTLGIIAGTLVLFSIEKIRPDVVGLLLLVVLVLTGLLPVDRAFEGLGSDTFVLVLGLLVMTAALERTGAVDLVSDFLLGLAKNGSTRQLALLIMLTAGILSSFMSNTGATAFFLPIVIGLAREIKITRSKLLMPLAFASILSSSVTLISTSTNIVVSGLIEDLGMTPIGMFEMFPIGIIILITGLAYMGTIGWRLIPNRPYKESFSIEDNVQNYLTEFLVTADSKLSGKTLAEAKLGENYGLTVVRVAKQNKRFLTPNAQTRLDEGDLLLIEGDRDELMEIEDETGLALKPRLEVEQEGEGGAEGEEIGLYEVILLPRSPLIGRNLKEMNFRQRYGLQVLGINRSGRTIRRKISKVRLSVGDQLIIHGAWSGVMGLYRNNVFRILHILPPAQKDLKKITLSILVFAGIIAAAALKLVDLPIAALIGMVLVFSLRLITPEQAYRRVDWRVLILIGCMLSLGTAIQYTGTASYLSGVIANVTSNLSPRWLLGGFFLLTMLLSQPMSNQAASAVVIPVAVQTALELGLDPRTFVIMIAVGASTSFLTPLEPACLMVYGPGNYRFADFLKVGSILSLIIFIIAIILVPIFWPFV
jgi:di/tricarboxylate transporter